MAVAEPPRMIDDPLFKLIRAGDIEAFNRQKQERGGVIDFSGGDFRGADLRGLDADDIDFSNAYFRTADMRGVDFRKAQLEGASLAKAQISGAYFPLALWPEEIRMSIDMGLRLRYRE